MLTEREAIEKTIIMWDWLAEHPYEDKLDALSKLFPGERPYSLCFACQYAVERGPCRPEAGFKCTNCPVWRDYNHVTREGSCCAAKGQDPKGTAYYTQWEEAREIANSTAFSAEIRDEALDNQCKAAKAIADLARDALWELEE